jgi:hypothetical protein
MFLVHQQRIAASGEETVWYNGLKPGHVLLLCLFWCIFHIITSGSNGMCPQSGGVRIRTCRLFPACRLLVRFPTIEAHDSHLAERLHQIITMLAFPCWV